MNQKLSIIIPCYNCENTLEEAVNSCYLQGLDKSFFEIILVDDKSTDNTKDVICKISKKYENVKCFYHNENMGGGATRNIAVKNSSFDLIFCLDSDDILEENTLQKMLKCLLEKKSDGIAFFGAYSFSKSKQKNKKIDFALSPDQPISLDYLFSGKAWVGGNFMYTKKAFDKTGGYPTDHSFDTQGFGFKFLANNLTVYPCPETFLYQRQFADKESYFERAYNSGEFSIGHYLISAEYINVFSERIQKIILNYDIFTKNTLQQNILVDLQNEYKKDPVDFFSKNKSDWIKTNPELEYQKGNFIQALNYLMASSIDKYNNLDFDAMRYVYSVLHNKKMTMNEYGNFINKNKIQLYKYNKIRLPLYSKILKKIIKYIK